jgi:hypothetical protein
MDNEEAHDDVNAMSETLCDYDAPGNDPNLPSANETHNSPLPKAG